MAYVQATINSTDPVNSEEVNLGAGRIRDLAAAVKERLASAFVDPDADPMVLKPASLPAVTGGWAIGGGFTVSSGNFAVSAGTVTASGNITTSAGQFNGSGAGLTNLPAGNLTGSLPALSGASLTSLNASNISSGTLDSARLGTVPVNKLASLDFRGYGNLYADNLYASGGLAIDAQSGISVTAFTTTGAPFFSLDGNSNTAMVYGGSSTPVSMSSSAPITGGQWVWLRVNLNGSTSYIPILKP